MEGRGPRGWLPSGIVFSLLHTYPSGVMLPSVISPTFPLLILSLVSILDRFYMHNNVFIEHFSRLFTAYPLCVCQGLWWLASKMDYVLFRSLDQWSQNLTYQHLLKGLLNTDGWTHSHSHTFIIDRLGVWLGICLSGKFPGNADAAGPGTTL